MHIRQSIAVSLLVLGICAAASGAERVVLRGHVPPEGARLAPKGVLPSTNQLTLAIGLPLRNTNELDVLIHDLYNPASTNYRHFLAPTEFTTRFGPSEEDYEAVKAFARSNGFEIVYEHSNRVILDVRAAAANVEKAFGVTMRTYGHPTEARDFYAPDGEPSAPSGLNIRCIEGLNNYSLPRHSATKFKANADSTKPSGLNGTGPNHEYAGDDFRTAYVPGTSLTGSGQKVALVQFSGYYMVDITNYENIIGGIRGYTNYVPLSNIVVSSGGGGGGPGGGGPGGGGGSSVSTTYNSEVALDIEMCISMAPYLSQVLVYESSTASSSILSKIATDNTARQVSSSWSVGSWSSTLATSFDTVLQQFITQGQSYFQASGDSDAYVGAQPLDSGTTVPMDSPYATVVGGTTLTMSNYGVGWSSETVWNYASSGGSYANVGSGGGISAYYSIPSWQTNINMTNRGGSATFRNIPDVALTADDVYVCYNNGTTNGSSYFLGTSCAAPLWAGFCALANQLAMSTNYGTNLGFLNPGLYAIANSSCYSQCFHDITTGNNIGTNTNGYYATNGYDLCTGLGTPNGTNLINALVWPPPSFSTNPVSKTATNGNSVSLTATAAGATPISYFWLFNGTNLTNGGTLSGSATNTLTISSVASSNAGNYLVVASNRTGMTTSMVAVLTVIAPPTITAQPTNVAQVAGSNAGFSVTATGSGTLAYQWRRSGTNLSNGSGYSGVTSNTFTVTNLTTNSAGSYSVCVTNAYGAVTSSVVTLTVGVAPSITNGSLTNTTVECGSNATFSVGVSGSTPLYIQWSYDSSAISGATNASVTISNVHLSSHTVTVTVTNAYASLTSNAVLTVQDTKGPVITLTGAARMTNDLGTAFTDPGATASDACAGTVSVTVSGTVDVNTVGTYTLTYSASDSNGNTNTATRIVVVREIQGASITLASSRNPSGFMDEVFFTATLTPTNASGVVQFYTNGVEFDSESISNGQASSTNTTLLPRGTNTVTAVYSYASTPLLTNTLSQEVTNHPPTADAVEFIREAGTALSMDLSDLAASWSDADGDTVSLAAVGASTNGVTLTNTGSALYYTNSSNVADQFVCAVTDGWGGTNYQTVSISIVLPSMTVSVGTSQNSVTLSLSGTEGLTYILESTTNLVDQKWEAVATNKLGSDGTWQFTDDLATNHTRFYRLRLDE